MRKGQRKLVALVLFALLGLWLVGCGSSQEKASTPGAGNESASQPAEQEASLADILAKGRGVEGMSYEMVQTGPGDSSMTMLVWLQGKDMRTESTVNGERVVTIVDGDTETTYLYYPDKKEATKMQGMMDGGDSPESPADYAEGIDVDQAVQVDSVTYQGVRCRLVTLTVPGEKMSSKMWVREDYGLPMRVETTLEDGSQMVVEYRNLKVGPISADMFTVPADTKVTDLAAMMQQGPGPRP
ncbi:MAG: hypothetical protein NUV35_02865 [Syntrophomonadaceae bacterium]|nr:hypothetical protein [Syntrophomonadaceae bacterium]